MSGWLIFLIALGYLMMWVGTAAVYIAIENESEPAGYVIAFIMGFFWPLVLPIVLISVAIEFFVYLLMYH